MKSFFVVRCWNLMAICCVEWGKAEGPLRRECLLQQVLACLDLFSK